MSNITFHNTGFCIFQSPQGERVLLNCSDFLANQSRVSMHELNGQNLPTIPKLIQRLITVHPTLREGEEAAGDDILAAILTDVLLVSRLIQSPLPVRMLELGCFGGVRSYHLATVLGAFHPASRLCCLGREFPAEWPDLIARVEAKPEIDFIASRPEKTLLTEGCFDVVFLNGGAGFEDPGRTVREALRVVKPDGLLLCDTNSAPLLDSCFRLFFEKREEYELSPMRSILTAHAADQIWVREQAPFDLAQRVREHLKEAGRAEAAQPPCLDAQMETLEADLQAAMRGARIALKCSLLEYKAKLLDYRMGLGGAHEDVYRRAWEDCREELLKSLK